MAYIRHPAGTVLTHDEVLAGEYQVNVGGRLYPAIVRLRPPFDPAGDRIKGRYRSELLPVIHRYVKVTCQAKRCKSY